MTKVTHLDEQGRARMVDMGGKDATHRTATARAEVLLSPETLAVVLDGDVPKGDVLAVARIAGITGGKKPPNSFHSPTPSGSIPLKSKLFLTETFPASASKPLQRPLVKPVSRWRP